jgi:hypothetical protein
MKVVSGSPWCGPTPRRQLPPRREPSARPCIRAGWAVSFLNEFFGWAAPRGMDTNPAQPAQGVGRRKLHGGNRGARTSGTTRQQNDVTAGETALNHWPSLSNTATDARAHGVQGAPIQRAGSTEGRAPRAWQHAELTTTRGAVDLRQTEAGIKPGLRWTGARVNGHPSCRVGNRSALVRRLIVEARMGGLTP